MSTQSSERAYTPWWGFAAVVLALLTVFGLFVSAASQSPLARGLAQPVPASAGTVAQDGKLEFSVLDVHREVLQIGDAYFGTSPTTGTYTVVDLSVRNTSTETVTFDGTYAVGLDSHGGRLTSDREAQYYANDDGAGMLTAIAPGQEIQTSVAFDVPDGATLTQVQLHDSVFSRGVTVTL